ncbi:cytochrome P450 4C1 [Leptinotarsa decemlineata]|uniref:cytochrome P450 4C1 n=1 Tax=Leptinotarsa decemlineata TaxID=7539 RepID=UPI003D30ACEE
MLLAVCFALVVGFIGILYIVNYIVEFSRFLRLMRKLPGPKPLPVFGNLFELVCHKELLLGKIRQWSRNYAPMYVLSAFCFPAINISGPEEFEIIASTPKNIKKSFVYEFVRRWLGDSLLITTGSKWHTRRKILTPAFHFNILQQFLGVFHSETDRLVETLKKEVDKPFTDVVPIMSQFTLYTIAETAMGVKLNIENEEDRIYVEAIHELGPMVFYRLARPWLYSYPIYYYATPRGYRERKLIEKLHKFTENIIKEKFEKFETFENTQGDDNFPQKKKLALLDLLLNAKMIDGVIDDEGIKDEVNTFMFEGHDTTSSALSFILMMLAVHKKWQDLIYEEIMQTSGESTEYPSLKDLNDLKLMERVIKESLRVFPAVPFIGRILEDDIHVNGYLLPKGASVHIHIFDIHKNPKYWDDPEKFDPDRFLPDNCVNRHPFAYVPFSAGPRNCIGQKFSMLEMKMAIFAILKNFVLEPQDTPESIKLVPDLVLRTTDEKLRVKFRLRTK